MLFETFYPDTWVDSTYQIDFDELYKKGYRGLIFDIDNTLFMACYNLHQALKKKKRKRRNDNE